MAGRKKKPVDLGALAERVNEVLTKLRAEGYEKEARVISDFIHAEGDFFRETQRVRNDIFTELNRQLTEANRKTR